MAISAMNTIQIIALWSLNNIYIFVDLQKV